MEILVPAVVAGLGGVGYLLAESKPRAAELLRLSFAVGAFWFVAALARAVVEFRLHGG